MSNSFQDSRIHKLTRDAAYSTLRNKDKCTSKSKKNFFDRNRTLSCHCGQCLLTASILRGQKLIKLKKELKFASLKKILTTPLVLKAIALEGLNQTITILFFSVALSFPLVFSHVLAKNIQTYQKAPSGIYITKEQIDRFIRQPPVEPPPPLQPPGNFRIK